MIRYDYEPKHGLMLKCVCSLEKSRIIDSSGANGNVVLQITDECRSLQWLPLWVAGTQSYTSHGGREVVTVQRPGPRLAAVIKSRNSHRQISRVKMASWRRSFRPIQRHELSLKRWLSNSMSCHKSIAYLICQSTQLSTAITHVIFPSLSNETLQYLCSQETTSY